MARLTTSEKSAISRIVGQLHVGTPEGEVAEEIRRRIKDAAMSTAERQEYVAYALIVHDRNRKVYNLVLGGI